MRPNKTALFYLAVLWPAAYLAGLGAHVFPQFTQGGFPGYSWPLLIAFVIEAALRPRIDRDVWPPLTMGWRFAGVSVGVVIAAMATKSLEGPVVWNFETLLSGF